MSYQPKCYRTDGGDKTVIASGGTFEIEDGAKANLTLDKHLLYTGGGIVAGTKKIQLTIAGGATTAEQLCKTWIKYQEIFSL